MKKVIRNDLWLIMLSYALLLNGYGVISAMLIVLADVYLFLNEGEINPLKMLLGLLVSGVLFILVYYTELNLAYPLLPFYVVFMGFNAVLTYELLSKVNYSFTFLIALAIIITFIFMMFLAIIMPEKYYGVSGKINLYLIIVLLYIPFLATYLIRIMKFYIPSLKHS